MGAAWPATGASVICPGSKEFSRAREEDGAIIQEDAIAMIAATIGVLGTTWAISVAVMWRASMNARREEARIAADLERFCTEAKIRIELAKEEAARCVLLTHRSEAIQHGPSATDDEALPLHPGSRLWFELHRTTAHATELMLRVPEGVHTGLGDCWLPLSAVSGEPLGWLRFAYVTTLHAQPVFAVAGWCGAHEPAPPPSSVLLRPGASFPAAS